MSDSNAEALQHTDLFADLEPDDIETLASRAQRRTYPPNTVIFNEGDPGSALFVIISGGVRISIATPIGESMIPVLMDSGDVFGELAILDGLSRSATATTTVESEFLVLARDDFLALVAAEPAFQNSVLKSLAAMIRRTNTEMVLAATLSANALLARALLKLDATYGIDTPDGRLINRDVTDMELAGMAKLHRIQVERLLKYLQYDDIIRNVDNRILIRRKDVLERALTLRNDNN